MDHRIAIDPQIGLSADEFVENWNKSQHSLDAPATVDDKKGATFLSPETALALITAAISVPATVIATFVSDYLKKKFLDQGAPKVSATSTLTPDGEPLLNIKRSEE